MKKLVLSVVIALLSVNSINYAIAEDSCQIDADKYRRLYEVYESCQTLRELRHDYTTPCINGAEQYLDKMRGLCQIQKINQAGSKEDYVCNGDPDCTQRYLMQEDYTNSLKNQRLQIDANVNSTGTYNVNHSGGVNVNHRYQSY